MFVKLAVLTASAVAGEQNIVVFESEGQDGTIQKGTIANLTRGQNPMTVLNLTIHGKIGGTFTLTEGSGPVTISGNHILEFPNEDNQLYDDQAEYDENEYPEENDEIEEVDISDNEKIKGKKRTKQRTPSKVSKQKKLKTDKEDVDDDDDDDDDDEEEEDDDDDEDDEDFEEEIKTKKIKKAKETVKKAPLKTKDKMEKESGKRTIKKKK